MLRLGRWALSRSPLGKTRTQRTGPEIVSHAAAEPAMKLTIASASQETTEQNFDLAIPTTGFERVRQASDEVGVEGLEPPTSSL
jgi:hypothetical protein